MAEVVREATGFTGYPTLEETSLYHGYKHLVATTTQFFRGQNWQGVARVFAALAWEPITSIWAGMDISRGKGQIFNLHGMNPTSLTTEQKGKNPVLLLHGRDGSQGMFTAMGAFFKSEEIGPVFTINLADGELTEDDYVVVNGKIEEIQKLYGREVKVDLVGYSRGAELAFYMALPKEKWSMDGLGRCLMFPASEWRSVIGKVIRIGSMTLPEEWNKITSEMKQNVYEIRSRDDLHMPEKSYANHCYEIEGVGHVGMVSSPLVFDRLKLILG